MIGNRHRCAAGVLFALVLAGCASGPHRGPSPLEQPGAPQAIFVVVSPPPAHTTTRLPGLTVGGGALAGGAVGAWATFVVAPLAILFAGPAAILAAPALGTLVAGGALVGAAGGAVLGAASAGPADQARALTLEYEHTGLMAVELPMLTGQAIEASIAATTGARADVVRDRDFEADPHVHAVARTLRGQGYGAVLELRGPDLHYLPTGVIDPQFVVSLSAQAILLDTMSGSVAAMRGFLVESAARSRDEWLRDDGALIKRDVERLYRTLAERAVETFVLQAGVVFDATSSVCGVAPREPLVEWLLASPRVAQADTLTPRLAWDPWPKTSRSLASPVGATGFRHDLRVWKVVEERLEDLVVERMGLEEPAYRFETPLEPGTTYAWSVRARYTVAGHPRASRWSAAERPYLPARPMAGVLYYGTLGADNKVEPSDCKPEQATPCGCLDFLPATAMWKFRTPSE